MTADPVFDMLATIALDQGADESAIACGGDGERYWIAAGGRPYSMGAWSLEAGPWPAYLASAMAAVAIGLPKGTDLTAHARAYDDAASSPLI